MKTVLYAVIALISLNFEFTLGKNDFFESSESENDWDPSRDFFGDHTVQEKDSPEYIISNSQPERKGTSKKFYNNEEDLLHKAYLARFINIFLRSSGFTDDVFEADSKTLKVDLTLSKEDFNILKRFVSDGDVSIEALENSFRSMFNEKHYFHIETSIVMEYLKYAILIALLLAIVFYIFFIIRKINFSIPGIRFILLFAYISIVLHELLKQYEDISENIVIRRIEFENAGKPPKECIYSKMTYLEKIYAHIFKDDVCQRFIQSRKSVWYEIDLVSVLVKPFQLIFSTLCSMLGEGNEKMIKPFIERSPWPLNIFLEFIVTVMQIPLLYFCLFLIWFTFTSRTISFNIPYICSMAAEKKEELNFNQASKKLQEEHKLYSSEGSKKTIVYNKGGIVLLGNEDKQYQSYSIQGSSSLNLNSQPQTFKISQQSYGSYMNGETDYSEDKNTSSLFNKQLALNKKEVRREHKKLTYFKKMNFKPNKRSAALKVTKENLDILPTYEH